MTGTAYSLVALRHQTQDLGYPIPSWNSTSSGITTVQSRTIKGFLENGCSPGRRVKGDENIVVEMDTSPYFMSTSNKMISIGCSKLPLNMTYIHFAHYVYFVTLPM